MPAPARKTTSKKTTAKKTYKKRSTMTKYQTPYHRMINDPWSEVKNVQIPDEYNSNTVGMLLKYSRTIQTDANGAFATEFSANPGAFWRDSSAITADVPSWSTATSALNEHPQFSSFGSSTRAFRPCGMFTRTSYIGDSELEAGVFSGMITTSGTGTAISSWGDDMNLQSATNPVNQGTLHCSAYLQDRPQFQEVVTNTITGPHRYQIPFIVVGGSGLPVNTACVRVETLLYLELEPQANSLLSFASKQAPVGSFVPSKKSHNDNPAARHYFSMGQPTQPKRTRTSREPYIRPRNN